VQFVFAFSLGWVPRHRRFSYRDAVGYWHASVVWEPRLRSCIKQFQIVPVPLCLLGQFLIPPKTSFSVPHKYCSARCHSVTVTLKAEPQPAIKGIVEGVQVCSDLSNELRIPHPVL
jgi:hypothetical protein